MPTEGERRSELTTFKLHIVPESRNIDPAAWIRALLAGPWLESVFSYVFGALVPSWPNSQPFGYSVVDEVCFRVGFGIAGRRLAESAGVAHPQLLGCRG